MPDDFRIPTKNELRESIDKAHDAEVKSLRDELARVRKQHLVIMTGHDCTWGIGSGRHCTDDKPCRTHKLAAAVAERDEAVALLRELCGWDWPRLLVHHPDSDTIREQVGQADKWLENRKEQS